MPGECCVLEHQIPLLVLYLQVPMAIEGQMLKLPDIYCCIPVKQLLRREVHLRRTYLSLI